MGTFSMLLGLVFMTIGIFVMGYTQVGWIDLLSAILIQGATPLLVLGVWTECPPPEYSTKERILYSILLIWLTGLIAGSLVLLGVGQFIIDQGLVILADLI